MEKNNKKNVEIANSILLPEIVKFMNEGHTVTLLLKGYSMRPFLEHGRDEGLLKKADSPKIGTPVLAEIAPGKYVLHRLIAVNGEKVTLLGDGNITPEYCRKRNYCCHPSESDCRNLSVYYWRLHYRFLAL